MDFEVTRDGRYAVLSVTTPGFFGAGRARGAVLAFARNRRTGTLTQIGGSGGCLRSTPAPDCGFEPRLSVEPSVEVSPDGTTIVVSSFVDADEVHRLVVLGLGPAGVVTGVGGGSCIAVGGVPGCDAVDVPLGWHTTFSPDGRRLYSVVGERPCPGRPEDACYVDLVQAFTLGTPTTLALVPGPLGCVSSRLPGCTQARGTHSLWGLAFSADARSAYVADGWALLAFAVEPTSGRFRQLAGAQGCRNTALQHPRERGCGRLRWLDAPIAMALSPRGDHLYVVGGFWSGVVTVFSRDRRTGALRQHVRDGACLSTRRLAGCRRSRLTREGLFDVGVGPDGRDVYVSGHRRIVIFRRARG